MWEKRVINFFSFFALLFLNKKSKYYHDSGVVGIDMTKFNPVITRVISLKLGTDVLHQKKNVYHQGRWLSVYFCKNYSPFLLRFFFTIQYQQPGMGSACFAIVPHYFQNPSSTVPYLSFCVAQWEGVWLVTLMPQVWAALDPLGFFLDVPWGKTLQIHSVLLVKPREYMNLWAVARRDMNEIMFMVWRLP